MHELHSLKYRDTNIIAIDALMGTGKSKSARRYRAGLAQMGIPAEIVSIDDDCPSREDRSDNCIDWHGKDLIPEVLRAFLAGKGSADIGGLMYNTATGRKDKHRTISVPDPDKSVLIIEGITILELAMRIASTTRNGVNRIYPIYLYCEEEERNRRRRERDAKKGLSVGEIERRIHTQQNDLRCYEKDTFADRFLKKQLHIIDASI